MHAKSAEQQGEIKTRWGGLGLSSDSMKNCPKVPITELLDYIVDNRGKTVPTADKGHVLIATNCIKNDELYPVFEKVRYLSQETYDHWFRAHPKPGDIIFVNKGTPGRVCMVPDPVSFCIAQDMMAFHVNPKKIYNKYLFAVLRSDNLQKQISNMHVGTLIPHFKKSHLNKIEIPLPNETIQHIIGDMYFSLSDKIELNNKINANLEQTAQAIFKSWFVDFEPFQDGEFVDSELGRIPKGWRVGKAEEFFDISIGKTPPRKEHQWFTTDKNDVIWVSISNMGSCGVYISDSSEYLTAESVAKFNVCIVPDNTVVLSFKLTVGRVAITNGQMTTNEAIAHFKTDNQEIVEYLFCYLKTYNYQSLGSTSSIATAVNSKIIKAMPFIMPSKDVVLKFYDLVSPIMQQIKANQRETSNLSDIRDTLLPKLMSGEIDVSDVEINSKT